MKLFSSIVLLGISVLVFSQTTPPPKFHDTKGNIEVTQAGQLQYTLGIDLPPGVKKTSPNVSLIYTSGGQNGLAGYGWNISGVTAISRVGKNLEKDGITKGVQLDYSDYYSFNGQRLILKSGEYGKDGAEYVTEKYSNIKIKSVGAVTGQAWQGPEYWEITSPDGSQAWYGAIAPGSSSARTPIDYNIVKSKDSNGNYITYNYILEGNVSVISNIQWGGNETLGKQHFNKIDFVFTTRPMPETAYIKGVDFSQSKLLESIIVWTNNKQYKKYNVTYKKDLQETAYRYLDKISVLNGKNEEANPVIFTYEKSMDIPNNPNIQTWTGYETYEIDFDSDIMGDFDGDGKLDVIKYVSSVSTNFPLNYFTQVGLYLIRNFYNSFYGNITPIYLGNTLTKNDLKTAVAVNLKKNNLIYNRQGFATYKQVVNPATSKSDLEISFYIISENNQLVLDFKKTIPNADYDYSFGSTQDGIRTTVTGLKNVDFNGDGLSEVVLVLNDKTCWRTDVNPAKLPHTCENNKRYYIIDPDESIQNNGWYYDLSLYTNTEEDAFTDYKAGDFNGDGLFDFVKLDSNKKPLLITFQKNALGKYVSTMAPFNPTNNQTIQGMWKDGLAGDYNGDGLSDIMIPNSNDSVLWYLYTSRGNTFKEETRNFEKPQKNRVVTNSPNENIGISNPKYFLAYDINNDGKTELIRVESFRNYQKDFPQDNPGQGVKYRKWVSVGVNILATCGGGGNPPSSSTGYGSVIYLNSSNIDAELAYKSYDQIALPLDLFSGAMMKKFVLIDSSPNGGLIGLSSHPYYDISMEGRIKSISQGGITTDITYKQLDKVKNPGLYETSQTETYPYVEINQASGMYVVSQLTQITLSDKKLKQDFRYRGLTSNILGRGMIGFRKTIRSSWYADGMENTKIWSGVEIDPLNDSVPVKEWSMRTNNENLIFPADVSENNTQLLSFKSTIYKIDKLLNGQVVTTVPDADKAKVVTAIVPQTNKGKDFLTGAVAESTVTYGEYYLPTQSTSKINSIYAVTTSTYDYNNNPSGTGTDYYIGRPKSKREVIQAYNDTKSGKEEYTYENNRIKTVKKWNRDNTGYVLDTYNYDGFGNITQKVVSNSVDSQTQTALSQYESTGRFVEKSTDNLGLETNYTYNDNGQTLTQTDPLDNILTNTYDGWGKLLTSDTNLEGTTSYEYLRDDNANITLIQYDPDGNVSKKYTNKLGQEYKISTKAFGQGQFVSKETQYDILGRKVQESEPYFEGQSPSQFNTIVYDDSVFPAKITATVFTGKKTETSVSGLTTTVKEINGYVRTTSKTTDALGNTVSTTDKGGTIQFSYNAAGEQTQAKYAENIVNTKFDVWGRKSEFNDPSNGVYKYEYDGSGQPKKIISPKGKKEYTYNALGQLISQNELSTTDGGQATNKSISFTYNNNGILTAKSGIANGQAYSTNFTYDPQGRLLSSSENSNGKTFAQKDITYDDKGRVFSYEKELQSSAVATKVTVENVYSTWNGELYQVKDKSSGKILWELQETNAKGLVLRAKLGAVNINNTYDPNGFLSYVNQSSAVKPNLLRLSYVFDALKNELKSKDTEGDFDITESFDYDDNNRLANWTNPVTGQNSQNTYDVKGRILENDQVGTMKYENTAKIYQPTGMTLNAAGTQNYNNDLIQSITFNENNDPVFIDGMNGDVAFQYGLTSMRQKVTYGGSFNIDGNGKFTKFYSEDGSFEIVKDNTTGTEKHTLYIDGTPYDSNIVYLKNFTESKGSYKFLHKDYLGSILAISDEAGNKLEQRHFDAWGNLTHLQIGSKSIITDKEKITDYLSQRGLLIDRGYTSHEYFAGVGIIHMNGRLYDPLLRRFLNADENIQDPTNTQNYNKYGYVMNNPLMYNDPNGEFLMWAVGALVGGYLNGVQANGSWNPGKWDWQKSWSAVLGGAIGGAAISGALGNIASNPGAIKSFLPGLVSGGLSSAFNGSNFLGGVIGGISYNGNLFSNRITSTDGINAGYKYIISADYNEGGETEQYFQMSGFSQYGASGGIKPPFSGDEIGSLASAGIISAVTARVLIGAVGAEVAGAGVIGAGGSITWSSVASTGTQILARTYALGLLLSVRGDSSPPRAYVYTIMGSKDRIAKFGITRAKDPDSRPARQISGINRLYAKEGPHSWMYLHEGVTEPEAFLYEKYYVWQYFENRGEMPYAQRYPKADAVTRFLYEYLKLK